MKKTAKVMLESKIENEILIKSFRLENLHDAKKTLRIIKKVT